MRAIVLVGGAGTRLRPLTYSLPKPLLPIANVAFLSRQLAWLAAHGIDEVVLSLGYLPDAFVAHLPGDRFEDMKVRYAIEDEPLGTAGGVRYAADTAGVDERFVVCNGDVLTNLDLTELIAIHAARHADATIHLTRVDNPSAFGVVPTGSDGEVRAFIEKPPAGRAPTNWVNAGTYVLEPSVLDRIPARLNTSIERETFPRLLEQSGRLFGYQSDDYWIDIGTPEKYLEAHADILAGRLGPEACAAAGATPVRPGVWSGPDVAVAGTAVVEAPALLGGGSVVGDEARVDASVLGAGCEIGAGAAVVRSVLLDGAALAPGAAVHGSVVGPGAFVGVGATVDACSVIGAGARIADRARLSGDRVPVMGASRR